MADSTSDEISVTLCDWHGRLVWTSHSAPTLEIGQPLWDAVRDEYTEKVKSAVSRVVATSEFQRCEATTSKGKCYHAWLWPLNSPDLAVCILAICVPPELSLLTARERECLQWLGNGFSAAAIAGRLDLSVSTVHTHLKRAREKLQLTGIESLIGFAAKYCHTSRQGAHESPHADLKEGRASRRPRRRRS